MRSQQWDIFCKVIDNFGDIGISWRLAHDLASRGQRVRLWVDDANALAWMAPDGHGGVEVLAWPATLAPADLARLDSAPVDNLVETFGCQVAPEFIAACASHAGATGRKPLWINLEYLSAEAYVARSHGLPSPIHGGPAAGWTKWFFFPGFTSQTGGLLRELDLAARQRAFSRKDWLQGQGIDWHGEVLVSLFCYEPPALPELLRTLAESGIDGRPVRLLVAAGRAQQALLRALATNGHEADKNVKKIILEGEKGLQPNKNRSDMLSISYLPWLTQADFDHLLWASDLNFVRGEDSIVRALWAGKPFVWQIYPQTDGAHRVKLDAFLDRVEAPPSLQAFHHWWNAMQPQKDDGAGVQMPASPDLLAWSAAVQKTRAGLLAQDDLVARLLNLAAKNR